MGRTVKAAAERTADCGGFGCASILTGKEHTAKETSHICGVLDF